MKAKLKPFLVREVLRKLKYEILKTLFYQTNSMKLFIAKAALGFITFPVN